MKWLERILGSRFIDCLADGVDPGPDYSYADFGPGD